MYPQHNRKGASSTRITLHADLSAQHIHDALEDVRSTGPGGAPYIPGLIQHLLPGESPIGIGEKSIDGREVY